MDSIQCQQGAKELVNHQAVLEKRMANFNYFDKYVINTQRKFSGTNLLLEGSMNSHSHCTAVYADPDEQSFLREEM